MGTEIFHFGPGRAEKFTFKDFNLNFLIKPKEKAHFLDEIPTNQALFWKAIAPSYLSNMQVLGVFWNPLLISFQMCTVTL